MIKMGKTGVRKCHSVTARTAGALRRDVIGRYHWLRFEPSLRVILLSCTVGVVSLIAGCTGTSGPSQDNAADSTLRAGLAASQTIDECLPRDIACRQEQTALLVVGPGDLGNEGGAGGGTSGSTDTGGDTGGGDTGGGDTGGDTGGRDNKGHGNGNENDNSADNGGDNTDADNPGQGGGRNRG